MEAVRVRPPQVSNLLESALVLVLITVDLSELSRVVVDPPFGLAALIGRLRANERLPARL